MFNIKWNGNQVIKETTSGLFKKEIGYNEQVMKEQEKLKEERVAGTAGGGMVTVIVTGHKEVVDVEIKEEAVDPEDVEMLQDLVLAATNEAMNKADELTQERLGKHTQGLNIPGM